MPSAGLSLAHGASLGYGNADPVIDAEVVQPHASPRDGSTAVEAHLKRTPENSPTPDEDAERTFDGHARRALVVVKCVVGRHSARDDHAVGQDKGIIAHEKKWSRQLVALNLATQFGRGPGKGIMGSRDLR